MAAENKDNLSQPRFTTTPKHCICLNHQESQSHSFCGCLCVWYSTHNHKRKSQLRELRAMRNETISEVRETTKNVDDYRLHLTSGDSQMKVSKQSNICTPTFDILWVYISWAYLWFRKTWEERRHGQGVIKRVQRARRSWTKRNEHGFPTPAKINFRLES